jgi:pimeloyl-ACP methyl ester carboxylesterase
MLRALLILLAIILLLYLAYSVYFYLNQRAILFPRHFIPMPTAVRAVPGMEQMWLETSEGQVEAWYLAPVGEDAQTPAPLLIIAHGNGDLIDNWLASISALRQQGIGVLLVEYPGYGRSHGAPTYHSIHETFLLAYDTIVRHPLVDPQRILLFGHSVGGGAVGAIAAERPSSGLILFSAFTSVRGLARQRGLPTFAVLDVFDNLAVVKAYPHPILIFHGRYDQTIPYSHGVALHAAAKQGELVSLECSHNGCVDDWDRFWYELRPFFERTGILQVVTVK